ncbi:unnamed protein product [Cyclocybe aegerita]|uniref:B30.2/SPRY domain-containing protein n=1 Tax=Cyclocybe aegerita TaxID=1973307 RepID=A0A8S0XTC9_CYCAE|nr:unnamed protein product [Cyclocybe aegerita]
MHAEGSSPPPQEIDTPPITHSNSETPTPSVNGGNVQPATSSAPSRKRKRPPATAPSPAPSDPGSNTGNGANATDLLPTSRADLSSRPILTISRGPIFVPTAEGSEWFKTEMVGVNRIGYRYVPAGINPAGYASPCRTIESNPTSLRVSWEDRSPFLKVKKDGLSICGSKGFRSARCNAPFREGKWYMEVKILHGGGEHVVDEARREGSHVRLGWGRREAPLNAPVGLDGYSYGFRDKTGEKVTLSRPRPYGRPFGTGDVVGMYISLAPRRKPNPKDPHDPAHLKRERIPIDLKGQEVFEILEYPQSKEMAALMDYSGKTTNSASLPSTAKKPVGGKPERGPSQPGSKSPATNLRPLPILPGSRIAFFVNGECQGLAFQDLYDYIPLRQTETQRKANSRRRAREGVKEHRENSFDDGTLGYYPFISLFNDASVRLNPGPDFEYPPPSDIDAFLDSMSSEQPVKPPDSSHPDPSDISISIELSHPPQNPMPVAAEGADVKPSIPIPMDVEATENANRTSASDTDPAPAPSASSSRTWRPAFERYPEFMAEEWAFDALEEEEAKVEAAKHAAADKAEEEKRKQREKRRQQAEARKKARKAAAEQAANATLAEEEHEISLGREGGGGRATPVSAVYGHVGVHSTQPSPSPLRQSTAYDAFEEAVEYVPSPAPTFASYGEVQGGQSGYTSENNQEQQMDDEMDVDQELEAILDS